MAEERAQKPWDQDQPDDDDEVRWLREKLRELKPLLDAGDQEGASRTMFELFSETSDTPRLMEAMLEAFERSAHRPQEQ